VTDSDIDTVDFYWRPGCGFCTMLDRALTRSGIPMTKHNIWEDPQAAATVRGWANGTETVPTVVVGDVGLVNPSPDEVIGALSAKAPDLVPEGWEPPVPGPIGSLVKRLLGG
jgi:mycoredoxin